MVELQGTLINMNLYQNDPRPQEQIKVCLLYLLSLTGLSTNTERLELQTVTQVGGNLCLIKS